MNTMKMAFALMLAGLLNPVSTPLLAQDLGIIGPSPYEFPGAATPVYTSSPKIASSSCNAVKPNYLTRYPMNTAISPAPWDGMFSGDEAASGKTASTLSIAMVICWKSGISGITCSPAPTGLDLIASASAPMTRSNGYG